MRLLGKALTFDDVEMLHASGDLRLDVDATIQRIESDHAARAGHKLPPRQPQDADNENDEAEHEQAAEDAGEVALVSKAAGQRDRCKRHPGVGERILGSVDAPLQ